MLMKRIGLALTCTTAFLLGGCPDQSQTTIRNPQQAETNFIWNIADNIPLPIQPADNIASEEKFELGRHLFYDTRLSGNGTQACVSCHEQDKAFSDGKATPTGSTGDVLARNSQALVNTAYNASYTWANTSLVRLEQQILIPLFGESPIEHGINENNKADVLSTIASDPTYQTLFSDAFNVPADQVDYNHIIDALAVFVRGLNSFNSSYDQFQRGDTSALSASALRGSQLFFSEDLECFHCHGGYNFTDSLADSGMFFVNKPFHNTGLFNIGGTGDYPSDNQGIFELTGKASDMGKFRAPTLRNIQLTAPYMHDGSIATLEEVVDTYAAAGRNITSGPNAGDGRLNPFKDGFVSGFSITDDEKTDLINFLESLTDQSFIDNPRFTNPWEQ
ncbi:Cytochrome c551 peroxidase [BD1-7 clade bacterium]|uniref:Cytochrome c551 peroxidase n=1 Tax=BD1-7 clade bacterium TaxID=2029982 RepID=A0A5S9PMR9_9GAMM|nr:Cytochrome c551 peroxidase [BD1-7 clade bacterium]CAA0105754.1 Cytochrome c551 peroxidase [BD1-7 clade bacterium]